MATGTPVMSQNKVEASDLENESEILSESLNQLSAWESQMDKVEKDADIYRLKLTQPMYAKRRTMLKTIPRFWYIIIAENDEFAEYASPDDLKYLEYIDDIYVHHPVVEEDEGQRICNPRDFDITISFKKSPIIEEQSVTKSFKVVLRDNGEEHLESLPVEIKWPHELSKINPQLVKERTNGGKNMTSEDKKWYRAGMKSFFSWFAWTGKKPGKEFRNGEDLANLISEDIFINALKYYIVALTNESEDEDSNEEDSSEGEELDLSDVDVGQKKRSLDNTNGTELKKPKKATQAKG
ncbi:hypothetical protein KGF57_001324 [Candida theae]|uniref:Vacuolar protein sorting-associated protein 75 n=1 Tax=Candida theae TaxID=1198502 RepID=A0AAD5BHP6_9ASCO|nr:uncharacterized protein KGF57_001324 [Candida theae]KAI5962885.1 hypothetical protein KGF57_001324 [Candida theae]